MRTHYLATSFISRATSKIDLYHLAADYDLNWLMKLSVSEINQQLLLNFLTACRDLFSSPLILLIGSVKTL